MPHHKSAARRVVHWRAPEFIYRDKSPLWYTNVVLFFLIVLVALFLAHNYVGMVVVLLAAWVFLTHSNEHPRTIDYSIDRKGLKIGARTIPFSDIDSFSINTNPKHPVMLLNLAYPFALPVSVVVKPADFDTVANILLDYVPLKRENAFIRWVSRILHY